MRVDTVGIWVTQPAQALGAGQDERGLGPDGAPANDPGQSQRVRQDQGRWLEPMAPAAGEATHHADLGDPSRQTTWGPGQPNRGPGERIEYLSTRQAEWPA